MRGNPWTAEQIELLRKLWAEGETAAGIGVRLGGMSRSAVLGKVLRLRRGVAAITEASKKSARRAQRESTVALARRRRTRDGDRSQPESAGGTRFRTLLELTNESCRWPYGSLGTGRFFFCGAPEADAARGIPYCARHMRRAYAVAVSLEDGSAVATGGVHAWSKSSPPRLERRPVLVASLGAHARALAKSEAGRPSASPPGHPAKCWIRQ